MLLFMLPVKTLIVTLLGIPILLIFITTIALVSKSTLELVMMLGMIISKVIVALVVSKFLFRRTATVSLIFKFFVFRLVSFSKLNLNFPLIKRSLPIHFLNSLQSILSPTKLNVSKTATVPGLMVFNHVHRLYRPISRKNLANSILSRTSRYSRDIHINTIVFILALHMRWHSIPIIHG